MKLFPAFPITLVAILLAGCASYSELPLPKREAPPASLSDLRYPGGRLPARLQVADVAYLVLDNAPALLAARAQIDVAQAQMLQAGLPPNPQVTGAILPLVAGIGTTQAWNAGLSYDIKSLLTLPQRRRAARFSARQVNAQLLWEEWQAVGQGRLLAVDIIQGQKTLDLLIKARDLLADRNLRSQRALAAGNLTLSATTPDLAAVQAARTQANDAQRQLLAKRHQLNALLGLRPDVVLPFAERADVPALDAAAVTTLLPDLPMRRPDLMALQLGYQAEDGKLRAAILAQFPNLTIGVTGGSDNSSVRNIGPQITLELPLFDRNQGNIAIDRSTRQQLHDEYAVRLGTADGEVRAMLAEIALLRQQGDSVQQDLLETRRTARQAEVAFAAGNLDERGYIDLVSAELAKELEVIAIEQSVLEQSVAIATLIGVGLPSIATMDEGAGR